MGASSWALGSRTVAALCHPSHPSASPPALAKAAASVLLISGTAFPSTQSVHISIPLWLGDFGCFSHPRSTMLWHISTWTDTFPTFPSGTCRSLKSRRSRDTKVRTGWEGLQGAKDRRTLQGSSENPRCQPRGTWSLPDTPFDISTLSIQLFILFLLLFIVIENICYRPTMCRTPSRPLTHIIFNFQVL